jgi:hypothetical protein
MVRKYKESMVQKLMESFDTHSAHLARFSVFDPVTLEVQTGFGDDDELLEGVERDLGINQGWLADQENEDGTLRRLSAIARVTLMTPTTVAPTVPPFFHSPQATPLSTWMPRLAGTPSGKRL